MKEPFRIKGIGLYRTRDGRKARVTEADCDGPWMFSGTIIPAQHSTSWTKKGFVYNEFIHSICDLVGDWKEKDMSIPFVSIVMPLYNHEKYVGRSVRSIQEQTLADWELIIVDNGCTDDSFDLARCIAETDERIRVVSLEKNVGVSGAINEGIRVARGQCIAFCSSDDTWVYDKLEKQVAKIEEHSAVFTYCGFIDDNDRPTQCNWMSEELFNRPVGCQEFVLRHFFNHGNFLCFSSALIWRDYLPENPMDLRLKHLQDWDLWIHLLKKGPFVTIEEKLTNFRIHAAEENLSNPSSATVLEKKKEHFIIYSRFFDGMSPALFEKAFGDWCREYLLNLRLRQFK